MGIIAELPKINISYSSNDSYNESVLSTSEEVIHCKNELNNGAILLEGEEWFLKAEEWSQIKSVDIDSK